MQDEKNIPLRNMGAVSYREGELWVEGVRVRELADHFGTPLYVYSEAVLEQQYRRLEEALAGVAPSLLICFALKANANPAIGELLAGWGAGVDAVSGGEIYLARRMGFQAEKIVFAGVGKTRTEMEEGLEAGIRSFHVESEGELNLLAQVAEECGREAPVAVRVNPDVEAGTHPYITTGKRANKFGVGPDEAIVLVRRAAANRWLIPVGLHAHVGSQLPRVQPIADAATCLLRIWDRLALEGIMLRELDIGGGLGISYMPEEAPEGPEELAGALGPILEGRSVELVVEPGRLLVGPAGVLITKVLYTKRAGPEGEEGGNLAVVDAGMNDLLRPALYGAWHPVWTEREDALGRGDEVDVVGPVCESSDVLARGRRLGALEAGDTLTIGQAGAYGYSMASQYNARPRPAEVLVKGPAARLIRPRESYSDLWPSS